MTKKVLTVDDSTTMRRMLLHALSGAGYDVVEAVDGEHGLAVLEHNDPDLIITDINMPNLDGFGLIERVRSQSRFRATPILVLTTEMGAEKKQRAKNSGATGWIVKPFEPDKLVAAVRRVLV